MVLEWLKKLKEAVLSTLPVVMIVLIIFLVDRFLLDATLTNDDIILFAISAVLLTIGMWLFNVGAEASTAKLGEYVGATLTKKKSIVLLVIIVFLVGVLITVAEPDLSALANQVPINNYVLIITIGVGVGAFLVVGVLRIIFQKSLKVWLLAFYALMFAFACLLDEQYLPISLDSGGVTTGPITVPFILALGIGVATSRGGKKTNSDSFGLVAFASIGPILMVMILSLILQHNNVNLVTSSSETMSGILGPLGHAFADSSLNVLISLSPIAIFFIIFNFIFIKLPKKTLLKILVALVYTYVGLVLFLGAVEAGFMNMGTKLGNILGLNENNFWILILVGVFLGIAAIFAEPAVHILTSEIETVSDGTIHKGLVLIALALGNGLAITLAILRIKYQFPLLYYIIPGYILAFILAFIVPDIYNGIAFDSGGVVSGPMNSTFLIPFATGVATALGISGADIMKYAFGMIALVAMMPLITLQTVGLIAIFRKKFIYHKARESIRDEFDLQVIHFE